MARTLSTLLRQMSQQLTVLQYLVINGRSDDHEVIPSTPPPPPPPPPPTPTPPPPPPHPPTCLQANTTRPHCWSVNIDSGNGFMPSSTNHYLDLYQPKSLSPYITTRPKEVNPFCVEFILRNIYFQVYKSRIISWIWQHSLWQAMDTLFYIFNFMVDNQNGKVWLTLDICEVLCIIYRCMHL